MYQYIYTMKKIESQLKYFKKYTKSLFKYTQSSADSALSYYLTEEQGNDDYGEIDPDTPVYFMELESCTNIKQIQKYMKDMKIWTDPSYEMKEIVRNHDRDFKGTKNGYSNNPSANNFTHIIVSGTNNL